MNIRKMPFEELELLSLKDIACNIIKEDNSPKTTVELFREICNLLQLTDEQYEEKIADFFTSLTTDKRFVLLNSSHWDLKENHCLTISNLDDDDDTDDIEEELESITIDEEELEKYNNDDDEIGDIDNDIDDNDDDLNELDKLEIVEEYEELEE